MDKTSYKFSLQFKETVSVLFLGHSFVNRLERFCLENDDKHNFGLVPESHLLFYKSRGGAKLSDCRKDFKVIRQVDANLVFLEIGTNDLDSQVMSPEMLAEEVFKSANEIVQNFPEVQMVVVLEVLFRSPMGRFPYNNPNFASQAYAYNQKMMELVIAPNLGKSSRVRFWHHRGMVDKWASYLSDGVHLNQAGMEKYYTSIRRAILKFSPIVRQRLCDLKLG